MLNIKNNVKTKALVYMHIATLLWGFTGCVPQFINLTPLQLTFWRSLLSGLLALPFVFMAIKAYYSHQFKYFLLTLLTGSLLALHWLTFYQSIALANISIGVVCLSTTSFFTCCIELFLYKHSGIVKQILISALSIVGLCLIFNFETHYRAGIIVGVISAFLNAILTIANKKILEEIKPLPMLTLELFGGSITLGLYMFFVGHTFSFASVFEPHNLTVIIIFSLFLTLLSFYLAFEALKHISAFTENIIVNLEPVYTILLAVIFFNEGDQLRWSFWTGLTLLVISVLIQMKRDVKHSNA